MNETVTNERRQTSIDIRQTNVARKSMDRRLWTEVRPWMFVDRWHYGRHNVAERLWTPQRWQIRLNECNTTTTACNSRHCRSHGSFTSSCVSTWEKEREDLQRVTKMVFFFFLLDASFCTLAASYHLLCLSLLWWGCTSMWRSYGRRNSQTYCVFSSVWSAGTIGSCLILYVSHVGFDLIKLFPF